MNGEKISDCFEKSNMLEEIKPDDLAWCYNKNDISAHDKCPVSRLFGSLHKAGRIHFSSAYCACSSNDAGSVTSVSEVQKRKHVSIDYISGGGVNHMLYETAVLTSDNNIEFKTQIHIEDPEETEIKKIAKTIKAIDFGILRIGSSKASGRLRLKEAPKAEGKNAEIVNNINPEEAL